MSLKTQMATDLSAVFMNTDDFAEAVTYQPQEAGSPSFAAVGAPGDGAPGASGFPGGTGQDTPIPFVLQYAVFMADLTTSLAAIGANPRNPMRGDLITIASGPQAGIYTVETWQADGGDGLTINAVFSQQFTVGADQVRKI